MARRWTSLMVPMVFVIFALWIAFTLIRNGGNLFNRNGVAAQSDRVPYTWSSKSTSAKYDTKTVVVGPATIIIKPGAEIELPMDDSATQRFVTLRKGGVSVDVKPLKKGERFAMRSFNAVAGIRGTRFDFDVLGTENFPISTKLSVQEGLVEFENNLGDVIVVGPGQVASIDGSDKPYLHGSDAYREAISNNFNRDRTMFMSRWSQRSGDIEIIADQIVDEKNKKTLEDANTKEGQTKPAGTKSTVETELTKAPGRGLVPSAYIDEYKEAYGADHKKELLKTYNKLQSASSSDASELATTETEKRLIDSTKEFYGGKFGGKGSTSLEKDYKKFDQMDTSSLTTLYKQRDKAKSNP